MKTNRRIIWLAAAAWLIQATIIPHLSVGRAEPDVSLIIVAVYAFLEGPTAGAVAGFFAGLLEDLILIHGVGFNVLTKTLIGYLSGLFERTLFGSRSVLAMLVMFIVSLLNQISYLFVAFIFGEPTEFVPALKGIILPSALYTSLLTLLIFSLVVRVLDHQREEKVFK